MKVLVAGTGFIGGRIVRAMEDRHEVKTLDRSSGDYRKDITEEFEIEENFDLVFHTIGLPPGIKSAEAYRRVHVEGTRNIIEGIKADKVVYISALKAGQVSHSFFQTKEKAEQIIRDSEIEYTVVRPSTVYGRGNKLLDMIRKSAPLRVFPDIRTETQPIHIQDLSEILEMSAEKFDGEILEVAGPEAMTVGEMAGKIYREEGFRCFLVPVPQILQETALKVMPFGGPFSRENIQLLKQQNTTEENDAERILGDLKEI